jgi:hypothetical protein
MQARGLRGNSKFETRNKMNDPAASSGVSSSLLGRHSVLDTESSPVFWIPAFAGMTNSRQAAGNAPQGIQNTNASMFKTETQRATVLAI